MMAESNYLEQKGVSVRRLMGLCTKQSFFERITEVVRLYGGRLDVN